MTLFAVSTKSEEAVSEVIRHAVIARAIRSGDSSLDYSLGDILKKSGQGDMYEVNDSLKSKVFPRDYSKAHYVTITELLRDGLLEINDTFYSVTSPELIRDFNEHMATMITTPQSTMSERMGISLS